MRGTIAGHAEGLFERVVMRRLLLALGALAVVMASFFTTLLILNYLDSQRTPAETRNAARAEHARLLKAALEKYKAARKSYPALADFNDVSNLQSDLVGGGYLAEIPNDPLSAKGRRYRYASNGSVYGLLFDLEAGPEETPAEGTCLSRAKADTTSFKGYAPDCPF